MKKTEAQWQQHLTAKQFHVLRRHGTERAFTSPLNDEKRSGIFHCTGCDTPLFASNDKFDSGAGWPSFTQPCNDEAVVTQKDNSLFMARTEVRCKRCEGHLGHVFPDGPDPTGLRYCINGIALHFRPDDHDQDPRG